MILKKPTRVGGSRAILVWWRGWTNDNTCRSRKGGETERARGREKRMVGRCLAYAAVVAYSSVATYSTGHAQPRAVIELFTSQGCSSCPAADKLMGEYTSDPGLVAVSLPIDYWDYLGWKDTLADPRNSARQKGYSKARGDREVYTPQVVVNGSLHAVGSDRDAIERAIEESRHDADIMSLPLKVAISDGHLVVSVPERDIHAGAHLLIWGLAKAVTVEIKRGENNGKTITYHNVARRWIPLGPWSGKANSWSIPLKDVEGDGIQEAAVMMQAGTVEKPSAILGAAMASLH
jgi:hypothetical protein